ncbi:hypothetical protein CVT26_006392 [Gymnopilus dilepis]|uniref:Secreted protein n=1 Tax=Gymnopilus dilepis TaxID=231916 RepID=A0A409Y0R8_9AGAR|nr:hypothetical protein CVT26_006392 [Gymnopilus dilepis]
MTGVIAKVLVVVVNVIACLDLRSLSGRSVLALQKRRYLPATFPNSSTKKIDRLTFGLGVRLTASTKISDEHPALRCLLQSSELEHSKEVGSWMT